MVITVLRGMPPACAETESPAYSVGSLTPYLPERAVKVWANLVV